VITGPWSDRRVLVSGGAGFIGSNLVPRLLELGAEVRVVDNLERGKLEFLSTVLERIEFVQGDLRVREACQEATAGIDTVFHLAAKVGGIQYYLDKPGEVLIQNMRIDANLLEAACEGGVARYVYASSAHVYPLDRQARPDAAPLTEEDAYPANPGLSYGWAKLVGERLIEHAVSETGVLRAAILRIVGAYGENQDLDPATGSAIPVFSRRAILHSAACPFVLWGTGAETRSYCYVQDVVDGLLLAADKLDSHRLVGPLNLGSEQRVTMEEVARAIVRVSGRDIPIVKDMSKKTLIWGQAIDCSKARRILDGWQSRVSLEEGLRRTFAHVERRLAQQIAVST